MEDQTGMDRESSDPSNGDAQVLNVPKIYVDR